MITFNSRKLDPIMPDCFENVNKSVGFPKLWTMRKSRYAEAEGGEIKLEACECFFRY
jgi:hypothetical protein